MSIKIPKMRVFIQHIDATAQITIAGMLLSLGHDVYGTLFGSTNFAMLNQAVHVVPGPAAHPDTFKRLLYTFDAVILSDLYPREGEYILDILSARSFVGILILVSSFLTWSQTQLSAPLSSSSFEHRVPAMGYLPLRYLEDRIVNMLKADACDPAKADVMRGAVVYHGLIYDSASPVENYLMEYVDYVRANEKLPVFTRDASAQLVPITSVVRIAMEIRNIFEEASDTAPQRLVTTMIRLVVDANVTFDKLLVAISKGALGFYDDSLHVYIAPAICKLRHLFSHNMLAELSSSVQLLCSSNDDFMYSNFLAYANVDIKVDDNVLASVQDILETSSTNKNPLIFENPLQYIPFSITARLPKYTIAVLGNRSMYRTDQKVKRLSEHFSIPVLSVKTALAFLLSLGESGKTREFWVGLVRNKPATLSAKNSPVESKRRQKSAVPEVLLYEDKIALIMRLLGSFPVTQPNAPLEVTLGSLAATLKPPILKACVMLYVTLSTANTCGYVAEITDDGLSASLFGELFTERLEAVLDDVIIDNAILLDAKKPPSKGAVLVYSLVKPIAAESFTDVSKIPSYTPDTMKVNPILGDLLCDSETNLKSRSCYSTYWAVCSLLDEHLTNAIRSSLTVVDDTCLVSALSPGGVLIGPPQFVDISCLHVPVNAVKNATILECNRLVLTKIAAQDSNIANDSSTRSVSNISQVSAKVASTRGQKSITEVKAPLSRLMQDYVDEKTVTLSQLSVFDVSSYRRQFMALLAMLKNRGTYFELLGASRFSPEVVPRTALLDEVYGVEMVFRGILSSLEFRKLFPQSSSDTNVLLRSYQPLPLNVSTTPAPFQRKDAPGDSSCYSLREDAGVEDSKPCSPRRYDSVDTNPNALRGLGLFTMNLDYVKNHILREENLRVQYDKTIYTIINTTTEQKLRVPQIMVSLQDLAALFSSIRGKDDIGEPLDEEEQKLMKQIQMAETEEYEQEEQNTATVSGRSSAKSMTSNASQIEAAETSPTDTGEYEDEYPNTAEGCLEYLRDTVGSALSHALASLLAANTCYKTDDPIAFLVAEMTAYTEKNTQHAKPLNLDADNLSF